MARAPIMLIDDDRAHLLLTRRYLEKAGADRPIISYQSGEAALTYLEQAKSGAESPRGPAVGVCEIKRPGGGALKILSGKRARRKFEGLSVVMLSAPDEPADISAAKAIGAVRYL